MRGRAVARVGARAALFAVAVWFAAGAHSAAAAADTICATVKLEILQKATMERVAFDAKLGITNNLTSSPFTSLSVVISIKDAVGNPADQLFFTKIGNLSGLTAVDGTGILQPGATGEVSWLIIPSTWAGGSSPLGAQYSVKATVNFMGNGFLQSLTTFDAPITVVPQPFLRLQYVLPRDVVGDDPLTPVVESIVPYHLGLRVANEGYGPAKNLLLDTGEPRIIDNVQGLAVDFKILGSFVGTAPVANTLQLPFGDIGPGSAKIGSWQMISSLRGRFIDFTATFTHDPGLGGSLTSLIAGVDTYWLIKDVSDDRPGRDAQYDFLISTANTLNGGNPEPNQLFSSDIAVPLQVANILGNAVTITGNLSSLEPSLQMFFAAPVATGFYHIMADDPTSGAIPLVEVLRSDGKRLNPRNFWQNSPYYNPDQGTPPKLIRIFDYNPTGTYTLVFRRDALDFPPDPVANLSGSTAEPGSLRFDWSSTGADRSSGTIFGRFAVHFSTDPAVFFSTAAAQVVVTTVAAPGSMQSLTVAGLLGNASYYARLWTADERLNWSAPSNLASRIARPYPPGNPAVSGFSDSGFTLAWSTGANLSGGYALEASTQVFPNSLAGNRIVSTADASATGLTVASLDPNTTYFLRVGALWAEGTVYTQAEPPILATLAQRVGASQVFGMFLTSATIRWQPLPASPAGAAAQSYILEASTAPDFSSLWVSSVTLDVSMDRLTLSALAGGNTYHFRVGSLNWNSKVNYAAPVSVELPAVLSVFLSTTAYAFGQVPVGVSTRSETSLIIANFGNVPVHLSVKASTATAGSLWQVGDSTRTAPATDRLVLRTVFHDVQPALSDFGDEDIVTVQPQMSQTAAQGGRYTVNDTETGVWVAAGSQRRLWLRLDMPTATYSIRPQSIQFSVEVTQP